MTRMANRHDVGGEKESGRGEQMNESCGPPPLRGRVVQPF
jgi:hypothetical protein